MRWLIAFLFLFTIVQAEEITTGNLITNGNFETGNANGWTTSGDVQVLNDCCELNNVPSNYDLEFGDSGSINQDFNLSSNTITQNMLDNGIWWNGTVPVNNWNEEDSLQYLRPLCGDAGSDGNGNTILCDEWFTTLLPNDNIPTFRSKSRTHIL